MPAQLAEGIVTLLVSTLRANYATALASVRSQYGNDPPLEPIQSIFVQPHIIGLRPPVLFVSLPRMEFRVEEGRGQQFVDADSTAQVIVMVEDIEAERLQRKTWRYANALFRALHDRDLAAGDLSILGRMLVMSLAFEDIIPETTEERRIFRRSATATVRVVHQEAF